MKNFLPDKCYMDLARRCQTFIDEHGPLGEPCPVYPEEKRTEMTKADIYSLAKSKIVSIGYLCDSALDSIPSGRNVAMSPEEYQEARDYLTKIVIMAELADTYLKASVEHQTKKPYAQIGKPKKTKKIKNASKASK